jgi:DNA uptake protein ComE-like DNA-binding protein
MTLSRIAITLAVAGLLVSTGCGLLDSHDKGSGRRSGDRVELNTASRRELGGLPALTLTDADRIIAARPYKNKRGLLVKKVLDEKQFDAIKDRVFVAHADDE